MVFLQSALVNLTKEVIESVVWTVGRTGDEAVKKAFAEWREKGVLPLDAAEFEAAMKERTVFAHATPINVPGKVIIPSAQVPATLNA